jgi:hypothetical protein
MKLPLKLLYATLKSSLLGAIALSLGLPVQAQSLQQLAQQYVDQNWTINPLANLAGNGCQRVLVDTPFAATVHNCSLFRNYAYEYWQAIYSTPGIR